ncbi:MAG: type I-A CRISPR-associated protein Cas4/Csa1 [Thermoprotei archaeon]|jgi:CRISPR-associated protein Csa1
MFFTIEDLIKYSRMFRSMLVDVSEELRGWNWNVPPLIPAYPVKMSVSDLTNEFCGTGRFVYLKYVKRVQELLQPKLMRGKLIHDTITEASKMAKLLIYSGYIKNFREKFTESGERVYSNMNIIGVENSEEIFKMIWDYAADVFSSSLVRARSRSPYLSVDSIVALTVPGTNEYPVDGTLIGLTKTIRIDNLLPPSIIVEYKTREFQPVYEVALAAYALAYESQYEIPINYAILVNIKIDERRRDIKYYEKLVAISDSLRQQFIDLRDSLAKIVSDQIDPGKPKSCPVDCPYFKVCNE